MAFRSSPFFPRSVFPLSVDVALRRVAEGAILLDVSRNGDWRSEHPRGATHIPLDRLEETLDALPSERPILTVGHSEAGAVSAARILRRAGFSAVAVRGGIHAWRLGGGEVMGRHELDGDSVDCSSDAAGGTTDGDDDASSHVLEASA